MRVSLVLLLSTVILSGLAADALAKKDQKDGETKTKTWCCKPVFAEKNASSGPALCTFTGTKSEAAQAAKKHFIAAFAGMGISGTITKAKCARAKPAQQ